MQRKANRLNHKLRTVALLATAAIGGILLSQSGAHADMVQPASHRDALGQHPHRPPPEAFDACVDKAEGADCQVTFRDTSLAGTCVAPNESELFCMPNDMPPPPDAPQQ